MNVDEKTVERIAELARLEFDAAGKERVKADLEKMLDFVGKLDELDTEGVEPLIFMTDEENVFRKDEAHTDITQADALKNAPSKDSDYFKVPKVLSKGQDQA